ncbi:hypothetical protein EUGRSUZ_L00398 [Eucalyptus grandis]|uniref:Uncharacterized protein n=2 Tax=Eucalyptus grandis TaxID=71139 RepID=A0ACC3LP10_EUCGR|nr:hypothetical protein EUGRSUZ_L00398 [Eucalyptus grandis]
MLTPTSLYSSDELRRRLRLHLHLRLRRRLRKLHRRLRFVVCVRRAQVLSCSYEIFIQSERAYLRCSLFYHEGSVLEDDMRNIKYFFDYLKDELKNIDEKVQRLSHKVIC